MSIRSNFNFEAFLDGLTGAGLLGKLRWPGAPTHMIDPVEHSPEEVAAAAAILLHRPIPKEGRSSQNEPQVAATRQSS
jgi:hypothetical protein